MIDRPITSALEYDGYIDVIHDDAFLYGDPVRLATLLSVSYHGLLKGVRMDSLRSWLVLSHIAVAAEDLSNRHVSRLVAHNAERSQAKSGLRQALRLSCLMMGDELSPADALPVFREVDDEWTRFFLMCRAGGKAAQLGDRDALRTAMSHVMVAGGMEGNEYISAPTEYSLLRTAYDTQSDPVDVCLQIKKLHARLRPRYCRELHQRFPSRTSVATCGVCAKLHTRRNE